MHPRHNGDFDVGAEFGGEVHHELILAQFFGDGLVDFDFVALACVGFAFHAADVAADADGDGLWRLDAAAAVAGRAFAVNDALDILARFFARDFDEAEARDVDDIRLRAVVFDLIAHIRQQFFLLLLFFHVDEVDNDDAADVAQANLLEDFRGCFEIRLIDSIAKVCLTDVFARIDIDDSQGLGLIDDEEAARLELDFARPEFVDFLFNMIGLENRRFLVVIANAGDQFR